MQVILLERVEKLGQMGDEVRVKDGFARNFLLPKKKALRATKANREYFQTQKAHLEAHNLERKKDADAIAKKLNGQSFVLLRQAGDRGLGDLVGLAFGRARRDLAPRLADDRGQYRDREPADGVHPGAEQHAVLPDPLPAAGAPDQFEARWSVAVHEQAGQGPALPARLSPMLVLAMRKTIVAPVVAATTVVGAPIATPNKSPPRMVKSSAPGSDSATTTM